MSYIKYMVVRILKDEIIKFNMNDYISERFLKLFEIVENICRKLGCGLNREIKDVEIGYFVIYIERVFLDELEE